MKALENQIRQQVRSGIFVGLSQKNQPVNMKTQKNNEAKESNVLKLKR